MRTKITGLNWTFYTLLFLLFFVFFSQCHPLVPFDSDDWINMGIARRAYPTLAYWNPTKVFPECFEPLVCSIYYYATYWRLPLCCYNHECCCRFIVYYHLSFFVPKIGGAQIQDRETWCFLHRNLVCNSSFSDSQNRKLKQ